jgi:Heterokaryon incompatibility protein (HET)
LCINQEDLDERRERVQMMSDIYRQARLMVSWLGESSDGSREGM